MKCSYFMVFHIKIYPGQNWFERTYNNLLTIDWQQVIQLMIVFNIMMFGFIGLSFLIEKLIEWLIEKYW
ncbi:hypothetical protein [Paenibacillus polymyxa]|uniref:Uncharacterized protein n=1 Tax=Paenibacillus polymyxa (strain SC2) TaxID=886882 RepID=E3EL98_PAEPS|nr:hypothetical protein [Paenibacillus polymyxa]ADO59930.1 hypothetical protein PPSC2_28520 [Paenibacillus polymyxa SC2]WPQ59847.1 hypothetical protein SKN87_26535 [Paenibacillus polymyxa]